MITSLLKTVISKLRGVPDTLTSELLNARVNIEHARQRAELEAELYAHEQAAETTEERVVVSSQKIVVPAADADIEKVEAVAEETIEVKVEAEEIPVLTDSEVLSEAKPVATVDESEIELADDVVEALSDIEVVEFAEAIAEAPTTEPVAEVKETQQEQPAADAESKSEGIDTTALLQAVIGSGAEEYKPFSRLVKPLTTLLGQAPTVGQILDVKPDDFRQMRGIGDARVKSLEALQALLNSQVK